MDQVRSITNWCPNFFSWNTLRYVPRARSARVQICGGFWPIFVTNFLQKVFGMQFDQSRPVGLRSLTYYYVICTCYLMVLTNLKGTYYYVVCKSYDRRL